MALTGGAEISSSTRGPGQGGTVRVTASDTLTLAGTSPDGRAEQHFCHCQGTETGAGNAGSVIIEAPRVALTGGAQISSRPVARGRAAR